MLKNLILKRPLAFIDVETTGRNPSLDRIVELSILKVHLDGTGEYHSKRIKPQILIPPEVVVIHGITNADIVDKSISRQYAKGIKEFLVNIVT